MWFAHQLRQGWKWELTRKISELELALAQTEEGRQKVDLNRSACLVCGKPLSEHKQVLLVMSNKDKRAEVIFDCP